MKIDLNTLLKNNTHENSLTKMKIETNSSIALSVLRGSLITNPNGAEFYIRDFVVDLNNLNQINVSLINCEDGLVITIPYSDLKDAKIQFQGGLIND